MKKTNDQKENFFERNKMLLFCILGVILLIGTMSARNVVLAYQVEGGEQYAVKLDYSIFGMCLRCYPGSQNSNDITEKAIFFGAGREKTVIRAAEGLMEIAGTESGTFRLATNGILPNNDEVTEEMIQKLQDLGYLAEEVE